MGASKRKQARPNWRMRKPSLLPYSPTVSTFRREDLWDRGGGAHTNALVARGGRLEGDGSIGAAVESGHLRVEGHEVGVLATV